MPAGGQRARLRRRDGDALGRRRGRAGVDGIGLPRGIPTTSTRRSGGPGATPRRGSGDGCSSSAPWSSAPGGRFVAALPASPAPDPERTGLYVEVIGDMNRILAGWRRAGRIGADTVAAIVVPVWMRTLDEIRAPFEAGGGHVAGLELERAELFRLDNPYWHDDPAVFAREYVRSVLAGARRCRGARSRARARSAPPACSPTSCARLEDSRRGRPRPLSPGPHRGARHLPPDGRRRARRDLALSSRVARRRPSWRRDTTPGRRSGASTCRAWPRAPRGAPRRRPRPSPSGARPAP